MQYRSFIAKGRNYKTKLQEVIPCIWIGLREWEREEKERK